jgi:hypothetical protein
MMFHGMHIDLAPYVGLAIIHLRAMRAHHQIEPLNGDLFKRDQSYGETGNNQTFCWCSATRNLMLMLLSYGGPELLIHHSAAILLFLSKSEKRSLGRARRNLRRSISQIVKNVQKYKDQSPTF